jgi:hypothetical protein
MVNLISVRMCKEYYKLCKMCSAPHALFCTSRDIFLHQDLSSLITFPSLNDLEIPVRTFKKSKHSNYKYHKE